MARLIRAEFRKVATTRVWIWLLLVAVAVTAAYVALGIAYADNPAQPAPPLTSAEGQRTLFAVGSSPAAALLAVLAAIGVAGEYRHRTATPTFLATPHRWRVLLAKVVAYAVIGVVYAAVCLAVTVAIAVPWLASKDITVSLMDNGLPGAFGGAVLAVALFAPIGVGLGALLREQIAVTVGLLLYLFVIEPIIVRIPAVESAAPYLPGTAARALARVHQSDIDFVAPWIGAALLLVYGLFVAVAGIAVTQRRDVA